jgi:glutaredoxin 2
VKKRSVSSKQENASLLGDPVADEKYQNARNLLEEILRKSQEQLAERCYQYDLNQRKKNLSTDLFNQRKEETSQTFQEQRDPFNQLLEETSDLSNHLMDWNMFLHDMKMDAEIEVIYQFLSDNQTSTQPSSSTMSEEKLEKKEKNF